MFSIITTASNNHFHKALIAAIVSGAFLFSSVSATAQISGVGTAAIDGTMSAGEWDGAATVDFDIELPEEGTTPGTLFIMNDADNLYMALTFLRSVTDVGNSFAVLFDNDGSGWLSDGDDSFLVNPGSSPQLSDNYRSSAPPCPPPANCGFLDIGDGGTNDGVGIFANDATNTIYEASKALDSADDTHDFSLIAGDTIGYFVHVAITGGLVTAETSFPAWNVFTEVLQIAEAGSSRILDFERLAHDFSYAVWEPSPYREDGFTITADAPGNPDPDFFQVMGSNYATHFTGSTTLYVHHTPTTHTLTNDIDDPFTLVSIDVSETHNLGGIISTGLLTYTGIKKDASIVTHSFELDEVFGPETIVFPATFSNLESVSVEIDASGYQYHQIDNVVLQVQSVTVVPGVDQVIFPPDPTRAMTAVVQEVVKAGTIKQLSCVIEDDRGTAKVELDLVQKIKTTQDCIDKGVAAELKLTDKAKLKKYQRAFKDPDPPYEEKIVVTLIKSKNTSGNPDDLTKGVVISEEDATKQGVTEPPCTKDDVSESPSTVGVNLSGDEPSGDKARNWTGTCNRTRSIGRFSDQLLAFPIRNDSAIIPPKAQVHKEASDFRKAVVAELKAGCVDYRFLRDLKKPFNHAMHLVSEGIFEDGINALIDVTLVALDTNAHDPYLDCPNDPKGHFVSRLMDLTYHVHRGMRFPDTFVEFHIDPDILALLPPFPVHPPPIP